MIQRRQPNTRRCSEREPADSLGDKFNVIGGWLPSLTFAFGDDRAMNAKLKIRAVFLLPILVILAIVLTKPTLKLHDGLRLSWFAHRIADTDRIVGTYARSSVSVAITGDDAKSVVRAVSSAGTGRPPFGMDWANMYMVKATFFRGTNVLDDIEMDGTLFLIHHVWPPFREDTGVLRAVVYAPVLKALDDLHEREREIK